MNCRTNKEMYNFVEEKNSARPKTKRTLNDAFYRSFIAIKSKNINLKIDEFLNEEERFYVWNEPKEPIPDCLGRASSIQMYTSKKINLFLEDKLRKFLKKNKFVVDNVSLLRLSAPTKPHIDGHFPYIDRYSKKFCVSKVFAVPIAFDTELEDAEKIVTRVITFKQHYNYFRAGGYEFENLYKNNKFYKDFEFEDEQNNILEKHNNSWIPEEYKNTEYFKHIQFQFNGDLSRGLDIQKIHAMKLGDLASFNPYQIHCTFNYLNDFTTKYVLRFILFETI